MLLNIEFMGKILDSNIKILHQCVRTKYSLNTMILHTIYTRPINKLH